MRRRSSFSPLSLSPSLWLKADAGAYTDAGTTLATNGQTLQQYNDQSSNGNNASQGTAGARPTWVANVVGSLPMIQPDATNDVLALTSPIALAGAFTVYAVGTRAAGTNWVPMANDSSTAGLLVFGSDDNIYFLNDAGSWVNQATNPTGTIIARFRRDASNSCKFAATGIAELTVGTQAGTMTMGNVFARPTQWNGGTNKHGELLVFNGTDLPTSNAAGDAAILAYLAARWGVTLP